MVDTKPSWCMPPYQSCSPAVNECKLRPVLLSLPPAPPACSFPWLSVAVVLPCALLTAAGVKVLVAGSALVVFEAYDSARLIWTQL